MDERYYELDPDGDVLLILRNTKQDEGSHASADAPVRQDMPSTQREPTQSGSSAEHDQEVARMRLSSKHLALASVYFRNMFNGSWEQAHQLRSGKQCKVYEEGWELEPFLILMNSIHGRTKEVPRKVTFEMLTKIATLVDYYKCVEVVGILSEIWINRLDKQLPGSFSKDTILWIWIAYVFRVPEIFNSMTKIALQQSKEPIQAVDLPIPQTIIDNVEERRQELIHGIEKFLHDLVADFLNGRHCDFRDCNCMLLGALTIEMNKLHLLSPRPTNPYLGFSFTETAKNVRNIESPQWVSHNSWNQSCVHNTKSRRLQSHIGPFIESQEENITGLKLGDFVFHEQ